ncbi:uncharacterized protein LOC113464939 isoform X1 [Ceratina calcarata]|uniref:Uncharacterized protein LOC113464939 isoform X1 n=1 Tax=Ceratina calcarata TaxID=156304 RepID=A0AAJ7S8P6_9HYME|nr:uncharacterized protein LOC113464939 isoform X1 [Ceratina calcarata]
MYVGGPLDTAPATPSSTLSRSQASHREVKVRKVNPSDSVSPPALEYREPGRVAPAEKVKDSIVRKTNGPSLQRCCSTPRNDSLQFRAWNSYGSLGHARRYGLRLFETSIGPERVSFVSGTPPSCRHILYYKYTFVSNLFTAPSTVLLTEYYSRCSSSRKNPVIETQSGAYLPVFANQRRSAPAGKGRKERLRASVISIAFLSRSTAELSRSASVRVILITKAYTQPAQHYA